MNIRVDILLKDMISFSTLLVAVTLPFNFILLSSYVIIGLSIFTIIYASRHKEQFKLRKLQHLIPLLAIFSLVLIGLTYTSNLTAGLFSVEKSLSLIVFPLIFVFSPTEKIKTAQILKAFAFSSFTIMSFYLLYQLFLIEKSSSSLVTLFHYETHYNIAARFGAHNTYLSLYLVFSIVIFAKELFEKKKNLNALFLYASMIFLLFFFIAILASRSQFIALILVAFSTLLILGIYKKRFYTSILGLFLFIIVICLTLKNVQFLSYRFESLISKEIMLENDNKKSDKRFWRWKAVFDDIDRFSLFGQGTGDEQQTLNTIYKNNNLDSAIDKYNSHNEYISVYIKWGWLGVFTLLGFFAYQFSIAIKSRNYVYFQFLLIISHLCLYESMFAVQKGIVFLAFFSTLFIIKNE